MYTMSDVNKLSNQRGWPQHMALSYYIELAATTGATVSKYVQLAYAQHTNKQENTIPNDEFDIKVNTYKALEGLHCILQDMHQDADNWEDYVDQCLTIVEQIREPYMYLSIYNHTNDE